MKESDIEGVASHDGPESCGCIRKGVPEALTGVRTGRDIEPRNQPVQSADAVDICGRPHDAQRKRELGVGSARSKTPSMCGNSMRENRESQPLPWTEGVQGRCGKAESRTPQMNEGWQSDSSIVPAKSVNKEATTSAESMEGKDGAKGNTNQQNTPRTQSRIGVPNALERVRQAARRDKKAKFTALMHHVTLERLRQAYMELKRQAAPGVDGMTWERYQENLEGNLRELHGRVQKGTYQAQPSRRVYIPKADGQQRALGIATLEDKVVQRAIVQVLNAIYEEDFLGWSYGFRPKRGQHDALDALAVGLEIKKVSWVLDADIRRFYDTLDQRWLTKFIEHRIADPRVLRLIQKWMKAGVMEAGSFSVSEEGIAQGASVSPLLANLYLHYVLDLWVQQWRKRRARGEMIVVRFADDSIYGFQHRSDAEQFLSDLRERLSRFALELHPDKTRLLEFGRYAEQRRGKRGQGKPETFDFLGFTHISAKTRSGKFQLRRQTMRKRMRERLKAVKAELKRRRHQPIKEQGQWIGSVVRGYFAYHAVPTNIRALQAFREQVEWHWLRALRRRSQRHSLDWKRMRRLSERWLPKPRILHPWPSERFGVRTRGKSPVR
jgi:RNA-directed DNA polymerase